MGLTVDQLGFGYPGRVVGSGVGFTVGAGEVLCLLGPNGGGKTTLLKTILGLIPPLHGTVSIDGDDIASWPPRRRALAIGYVPQAAADAFPFSVREMVLMGRTAHRGAFAAPTTADRDSAEACLAQLGIGHLGDRDWLHISGGERQLALIARALAQAPRVLVLDEPTASLDFGNQLKVLQQLQALAASGLAIVFSTHHPEQAFACADRVAMLHDGKLAYLGTPDEVITPAAMRAVYEVEVEIVQIGPTLRVCVPAAFLTRHLGSS